MTVRELINLGADQLKTSTESPRLDSSLILAHVLKMDRAKLFACYPDIVNQEQQKIFKELVNKRESGHPVAYILGEKEFFGHTFYVEEGVLTPRPDTEILVETAISLIESNNLKTCIDMCTGTGCVSISIKKAVPSLNMTATDISPIAEKVFKINNKNLTNNEVSFIHSNLYSELKGKKYDIIVTNPPYLTKKETEDRMEDGWKEPELALDGGDDGLDLIRTIIRDGQKYLNNGGWLLIEAGPAQMDEMKKEMQNSSYSNITILKDIEERDRIIVGQNE